MKKILQLFIFSVITGVLLLASGIDVGFKTASAYYPVSSIEAFTPTGYASISATSSASASAALGSTGASSPIATTAVFVNTGSNTAYVALGASNVSVTTATGYPVPASQSVALTVRNTGYAAAITATGTTTVSVITGY